MGIKYLTKEMKSEVIKKVRKHSVVKIIYLSHYVPKSLIDCKSLQKRDK